MTFKTINALRRYFEALYQLNQNTIILCGVDILDNDTEYETAFENVISLIPRLVPYVKKNGAYTIRKDDGLLEFSEELPFLEGEYQSILQAHLNFLSCVKEIRNKLEHRMHGAKVVASSSGSGCLFEITYEVEGERIELTATALIAFVKDLNILFSKLQKLVDQFAYEHGKTDNVYYCRLVRYCFSDFNRIYESDLLRVFGKALLPF